MHQRGGGEEQGTYTGNQLGGDVCRWEGKRMTDRSSYEYDEDMILICTSSTAMKYEYAISKYAMQTLLSS
jgi:hypothetical protein